VEAREPASVFWNRRYEEADGLWSRDPNPLLVEFAAALAPGRALDLGAGEGRNAIWLAKRGWRVTALDVSAVGLARAADRAADEGVELDRVVADWREYDPPASSIDLAVITFMHPQPHERVAMFESVRETLVPGGHLFIVGVDLAEHGRRGPPDADRLYTPQRLSSALQAFELLRCESVAYEAESKKERRNVVDVVAIARRPDPRHAAPA
jgi:SAM-dependent methyltransferase